ncbi:unnamed protein product [Spirodela intermedia]|uniref:Uncharacterized protein n=1 Tax=Spirodela intermedia TaxID=51605 RepID=A0A7I8KFJ7_SPIIN|nr:unnamed protein product [Spirodela intermedia]
MATACPPPSLPGGGGGATKRGRREQHVAAGYLRERDSVLSCGTWRSLRSLPCRPPATTCFVSSSFSSSSSSDSGVSLTASVGSPPPAPALQWRLDGRHVLVLNILACAAGIASSWLLFSAIPTLLAFKRAAESIEKLLDATREELPDTMAAVRLSGMEISDLTMELSELGQEISQGVRSSTRAVRQAEGRLRGLMAAPPSTAAVQRNEEAAAPAMAAAARNLREGIVKGRSAVGVILALSRFSQWALGFIAARRQKDGIRR